MNDIKMNDNIMTVISAKMNRRQMDLSSKPSPQNICAKSNEFCIGEPVIYMGNTP